MQGKTKEYIIKHIELSIDHIIFTNYQKIDCHQKHNMNNCQCNINNSLFQEYKGCLYNKKNMDNKNIINNIIYQIENEIFKILNIQPNYIIYWQNIIHNSFEPVPHSLATEIISGNGYREKLDQKTLENFVKDILTEIKTKIK